MGRRRKDESEKTSKSTRTGSWGREDTAKVDMTLRARRKKGLVLKGKGEKIGTRCRIGGKEGGTKEKGEVIRTEVM